MKLRYQTVSDFPDCSHQSLSWHHQQCPSDKASLFLHCTAQTLQSNTYDMNICSLLSEYLNVENKKSYVIFDNLWFQAVDIYHAPSLQWTSIFFINHRPLGQQSNHEKSQRCHKVYHLSQLLSWEVSPVWNHLLHPLALSCVPLDHDILWKIVIQSNKFNNDLKQSQ